jgi:plasmid stability protein
MRINLNLPEQLAVALKQFAATNRRTVTAEAILALEAYLKEVMKKEKMDEQ